MDYPLFAFDAKAIGYESSLHQKFLPAFCVMRSAIILVSWIFGSLGQYLCFYPEIFFQRLISGASAAVEANQAAILSTVGLAGSAVTRDKDVTADSTAVTGAGAEGPVSVAMQVDSPLFQLYTSGVFSSSLFGAWTME